MQIDMDLDLRKLRYFVAVAQALNFRQAAEDLHIAQPVLSRQIKALEKDLSVVLFERGPRGTTLTSAGEQLLADAMALLTEATATVHRLREAASPWQTITVGVMPGLLATAAISTFTRRHPRCRVDVQSTTWASQVNLIRDGSLDISIVREPFAGTGLRVASVASEERLALLPRNTELASHDSLTISDLASVLLLQDPDLLPQWAAATTAELRRKASRAAAINSVEEKLERVASGAGFVVLPQSTCAFYRRPDVRAVPLTDLPVSGVSVVTRHEAAPAVHELAEGIIGLGQSVVAPEQVTIAAVR